MFIREDFLMLAPARRHPQAAAVEAISTALAGPLLDPVTARRFAAYNRFTAYVFPDASVSSLVTTSMWVNWMYLFDDEHDEAGAADAPALAERVGRSIGVLRGEAPPVDALDAYLAIFRRRLEQQASPAWLARFLKSAEDYLTRGTLATGARLRAGDVGGVEEYLERRSYDGAVATACDLIELHEGVDLPAEVRLDPAFQALRGAVMRTVASFNDIVSFPKEVLEQNATDNLVAVLRRALGCSVEDALLHALHLTNEAALDMIAFEAVLLRRHPVPGLRAVLAGYRALQTGNITASLGEARYRSALSPLAELRPAA